ncbi:MAG TPA: hypothetical protein VFG16_10845, partial [Streptomyces sp.]|nr:hypothetical protein [Streptomyces sp.]
MSAPVRNPSTPPPAVTQPGARPGPPTPGKLKAVRKRPAQAAAAPAKERGTTTAIPTKRPGRARPAVGNAATAALAARG